MSRSDRRYEGGPEYALDRVRACIAIHQLQVTRKALRDAASVLPDGTIAVFATIKGIVLGLGEENWMCAQLKEGAWVDIYRVSHEGRPRWVKLKVELTPQTKETAVVVSFHDWDPSRSI